jgi:hypothetical protein
MQKEYCVSGVTSQSAEELMYAVQLHISEDFLYLYHASLDDHAV